MNYRLVSLLLSTALLAVSYMEYRHVADSGK